MSLKVRLPDLPILPKAFRGRDYVIPTLLTEGADNTKLAKGEEGGLWLTWGVTLAPAMESGRQMCSHATDGCARACLHHQGRARVFALIKVARVAKTVALMEHRGWFMAQLRREMEAARRKCERENVGMAFRPNVLSDFAWHKAAPWMFSDFPDARFYDYTKVPKRAMDWAEGRLPPNYHVTFSRGEANEADALRVMGAGGNVSVVFRGALPRSWRGSRVIDGDENDLRFLDPPGVVVGLKAKGTAKKDESGFVVDAAPRRKRVPLAIA